MPSFEVTETAPARLPSNEVLTCPGCLGVHGRGRVTTSLMVCPTCGYHLRLAARERLGLLFDDPFIEWDAGLTSLDPLRFVDKVPYPVRLRESQQKTGERDAIVTGSGTMCGRPLAIGAFDFGFMGGSMGSVVGEKIFRLFTRAAERQIPVVVVTASGGARMQEGTIALMQMAKVSVAIQRFRQHRLPFISVISDPTTGGVAASVASLGDVICAEPGAQIGFAGPRVIEQTIRAPLPKHFQRAENLLKRGMIDDIVQRGDLRRWLHTVLRGLSPGPD